MTKRVKHKLGICRRYMEDFFATLLVLRKKVSRVSKVICKKYEERFEKMKLRKLKRLEKSTYERSIRDEILNKYKILNKLFHSKPNESLNIKSNSTKIKIKENLNLKKIEKKQFQKRNKKNEFNYIKMQPYNHKQTHIKIGNIKFFLYRIDIGKPKERGIKRNKHFLILMSRQKIRRFCSQFPLKVIRKYLQIIKHRSVNLSAFLVLLETRLDFLLYRMNVMSNQPLYFRQLINHNSFKFLLQNKVTNLSGQHLLKIGEIFKVSFRSKKYFYYLIQKKFLKNEVFMSIPNYMLINYRLMYLIFFKFPTLKTLSFPIRLAFLVKRLPSMSYKFH